MTNLVTVATFTLPTEMAIIKARLESEGIECFLKDELTVQVDNFMSQAIGGVKLQVQQKDLEKALEILKEVGHSREEDASPPQFWIKADRLTRGIPVLGKLRTELRLMYLVILIILLLLMLGDLLS